jgi:hypothetical protein
MTDARLAAIAAKRQKQPITELERKWKKAQGRWSRAYWSQEWLDLAAVRANEIWLLMQNNIDRSEQP